MLSSVGPVEVDIVFEESKIFYEFTLDDEDLVRIAELNFDIGEKRVYVDIGDQNMSIIHPDLICLSVVLLCNPFVGRELKINHPMSEQFQSQVQSVISRYKLIPSPEVVEKIPAKSSGYPALAFSGGADSTAALALMPRNCIPIFLWREENSQSVYSPNAPLRICKELEDCGFEVHTVVSDLEKIRDPIGFPTDLANAIPAILLSEILNLDSISFGTVLESGFGIGHEKYIDYGKGAHWRFYSTLFNSVGLGLSLPTIGVSEVGTALINSKSIFGNLNQSCIRGSWKKPCLKCWKCFRKELLMYSLNLSDPPDFASMMKTNEVQVRLSSYPISHENVIIYSLQRINLEQHAYFKPLADKLDMSANLELLHEWYSPSLDFVPKKYRHTIRDNILSFIDVMSPMNEFNLMNWDMEPHLKSKRTISRQEKFTSFWQDFTQRFG